MCTRSLYTDALSQPLMQYGAPLSFRFSWQPWVASFRLGRVRERQWMRSKDTMMIKNTRKGRRDMLKRNIWIIWIQMTRMIRTMNPSRQMTLWKKNIQSLMQLLRLQEVSQFCLRQQRVAYPCSRGTSMTGQPTTSICKIKSNISTIRWTSYFSTLKVNSKRTNSRQWWLPHPLPKRPKPFSRRVSLSS